MTLIIYGEGLQSAAEALGSAVQSMNKILTRIFFAIWIGISRDTLKNKAPIFHNKQIISLMIFRILFCGNIVIIFIVSIVRVRTH